MASGIRPIAPSERKIAASVSRMRAGGRPRASRWKMSGGPLIPVEVLSAPLVSPASGADHRPTSLGGERRARKRTTRPAADADGHDERQRPHGERAQRDRAERQARHAARRRRPRVAPRHHGPAPLPREQHRR